MNRFTCMNVGFTHSSQCRWLIQNTTRSVLSARYSSPQYVMLFTFFGLWIAEIVQSIFNSIKIGILETKTTFNRIALYLNHIAFFMTSHFNSTIQRNSNKSHKILLNPESDMDVWEYVIGFKFFIRLGAPLERIAFFNIVLDFTVPYFNCPQIIVCE